MIFYTQNNYKVMIKYNEDLEYLIRDLDISKTELEAIIVEANKIISDANSEKDKLIEAYLKKVQCLQKLGRGNESKEFIDKLLALNPNMSEALVRLGGYHHARGEYNDAIECITKAIEINPNYASAYFNRGVVKRKLFDSHGAIEDYDKAIELKPDYASAYYNRGNVKYNLRDYIGAIEDYDRAIDFKYADADAYNNRGNAKTSLPDPDYNDAIKDYNKAIDIKLDFADAYYNRGKAKADSPEPDLIDAIKDFTEAIKIEPENAEAYNDRGTAKTKLPIPDHLGAIEDYDKAIEIYPYDARAYYNRGTAKSNLFDYIGAIKDYDEAIEISPDYASPYYNRGVAKAKLPEPDYFGAMEDYNKAVEIDPTYADSYGDRGNVKYQLSDYQGAIEDYDLTIEINPNHVEAYSNRGLAKTLLPVPDYLGAIKDYNKAIDIAIKVDRDCAMIYHHRGIAFVATKEFKKAAEDFTKAKTNILRVLMLPDGKKTAYLMLDDDDFFKKTTENCKIKDIKIYEDIYIESLEIITKLQVEDDKEMPVSHYTQKAVAENLLFFIKDNEKMPHDDFRLYSVAEGNDRKEGKTLLDYLFPKKNFSLQVIEEEKFDAFAGCFILNKDSLNQFRLYGKKEKEEGTGVSIILKKCFFNNGINLPVIITSPKEEKNALKLLPLFRCIYIDPETNKVVSLGQKEEYVFYRENEYKNEVQKIYEEYKKEIDKICEDVSNRLATLKNRIEEEDIDYSIVFKLLLNLRYLIKHVAFKEEQECRIIQVKEKKDEENENEEIGWDEWDRPFVKYLKMYESQVSGICFGPKAKGFEKFKQDLTQNNYSKKICYKSKAPLK